METLPDGSERPKERDGVSEKVLRGVAIDSGGEYVVYGAGSHGRRVLDRIRQLGGQVVAFADRDPGKQAAGMDGLPVIAPRDLVVRRRPGQRIIVATMYVESAIETLTGVGLREGADFIVPAEFDSRCSSAPAGRKRAILFGASRLGEQALPVLRAQYDVVAFVDNDSKKWGSEWNGVPVHGPEHLRSARYDHIIITSSFHEAIGKQLVSLGFPAYEVYGGKGAIPVTSAQRLGPVSVGEGQKREPDILDRIGIIRQDFGETLALIHRLGHSAGTLIDVGVAFGTPELYKAFPEAHLLLVEPLEEFRPYMEKIVAGRSNACFVVAAGGDRDGFVDITVTPDKSTSSLLPLGSQPRRRVPMARIDTLCRKWNAPPPYVIKIDVQGHELTVMNGCTELLSETLAIVLEVSFRGHTPEIPEFFDVLSYMKQRGFVAYEVLGGHNRPLDFARCQADVVFVQENGPLRADRRWSTPEQNALFREAKRARSVFRDVMGRA